MNIRKRFRSYVCPPSRHGSLAFKPTGLAGLCRPCNLSTRPVCRQLFGRYLTTAAACRQAPPLVARAAPPGHCAAATSK